jgi:hypothetical protein
MSAIFDLLPVLPQQQTWKASSPTSEFDPEETLALDGLIPLPPIQSRSKVALKAFGPSALLVGTDFDAEAAYRLLF